MTTITDDVIVSHRKPRVLCCCLDPLYPNCGLTSLFGDGDNKYVVIVTKPIESKLETHTDYDQHGCLS